MARNYFELCPNEIVGKILYWAIQNSEIIVGTREENEVRQKQKVQQSLWTAKNTSLVCKRFCQLVLGENVFNSLMGIPNKPTELESSFNISSQEIWRELAGNRWFQTTKVNKVRSWYKFYRRR
jgi:hypothetical protein